ncbi:MAG: hypothetical protein ABIP64_06290, partial [Burkholderiales bacterium]
VKLTYLVASVSRGPDQTCKTLIQTKLESAWTLARGNAMLESRVGIASQALTRWLFITSGTNRKPMIKATELFRSKLRWVQRKRNPSQKLLQARPQEC